MPWKECKPMDERLRFIARLLEGEKMAPLEGEKMAPCFAPLNDTKSPQPCGDYERAKASSGPMSCRSAALSASM
jgi:hypothetical protein